MKRKMILKTTAFLSLAVIFIISAAFLSGCGQSPDKLYTEGKTLIQKKETEAKGMSVLESFEKKFPKDPRTPEVILAIATINQSEKKFKESEAAYNRLQEKYPKSAEAYKGTFLLGYMYYEDMKDTEKAKAVLNKFIAAYPDSGLTVSAKVLLENVGLPVEQWSTVKNIISDQSKDAGDTAAKNK